MLSWKIQFLYHIYSPNSQIWKILRKKGVFYFQMNISHTHIPMLSLKMQFLPPYLLFKQSDLKISKIKWVFFFQEEHFKHPHPYVLWKNAVCAPYISSPGSWIWNFLTRTAFSSLLAPQHLDPGPPSTWTQTLDPSSTWTLDPYPPHTWTMDPRSPIGQTDNSYEW